MSTGWSEQPRYLWVVGLFFLAMIVSGCARHRADPYSPHENLLSIAAEFQLLTSRDPYRDEPAEELTGQNIARATLVRLANYESLHPGQFEPEIAALKGRAYEWLGDFESARRAYLVAAEPETPLREDCLRRVALDEQLLDIRSQGEAPDSIEQYIVYLAGQIRAFNQWAAEIDDPYYASLALAESEQAEVNRAELLASNRWLLPDGETQAIDSLRALVANHTQSARSLEHALRLGRLYRELAEQEIRLHPPTRLDFDKERALGYLDQSLDVLYRVSQADGRPERLVAAQELDTVLVLREMVVDRSD